MVGRKMKESLWMRDNIYTMRGRKDKTELECWVCKRNAREVRADLERFTRLVNYPRVDIEKAIAGRAGVDYDDEYSREGDLIRLVDTENDSLPCVPLCLVCQGVLLNLGRDAAYVEIMSQLEDAEQAPEQKT